MNKASGYSIPIIIILVLIGWYSYNYFAIKNYEKVCYSQENADVIIVLGAGTSMKGISHVFKERLNQALALYLNNKSDYILITGGYGKKMPISDSRIAKKYLAQELDSNHIYIEEKSTTTYQNLYYAKEIMQANHWESALIVSDPYHMYRAIQMCNKLGIKASPYAAGSYVKYTKSEHTNYLRKEALNTILFQIFGK